MKSNELNVFITADSPCDLPCELTKKYGVTLIPLYLRFGGQAALRDGVEISTQELIERYERDGILPKTAAPSPGDYLSVWEKMLKKGGEILHLSLSSGISSAYQAAKIAALGCEGVRVFNSTQLCGAYALAVLYACGLRDKGLNAAEIVRALPCYISGLFSAFLVEDNSFLHAGGRCSQLEPQTAKAAAIYQSLTVKDGIIVPYMSYSGDIRAARESFIKDVLERVGAKSRAVLVHTGLEQADFLPLKQLLNNHKGLDMVITNQTGGVISAHCGKGTVGIFIEESGK